mgnify:CR=1 FL=1
MKRWALPALVLTLVLSLPPSLHAQAKDTLTVALVSHAPTMDPHMHFERVGILVNINMFDSLLHRNTKLLLANGEIFASIKEHDHSSRSACNASRSRCQSRIQT